MISLSCLTNPDTSPSLNNLLQEIIHDFVGKVTLNAVFYYLQLKALWYMIISCLCVLIMQSPLFSIYAMTLCRWHLLFIFSCLNILSLISLDYKSCKSYSVKSSLSFNLGLNLCSYVTLFFPNSICYLCIFCFPSQISQGSLNLWCGNTYIYVSNQVT